MISVGEQLPDVALMAATGAGQAQISTKEYFAGVKVILFAVPGAFTPTCHMNHLPGFIEHRDTILARGTDKIAVISVNDIHVMSHWAKASGGEGKIDFLADGSAAFTKAVGVEIDLNAANMGVRSKRYSMIVEDGVVRQINLEQSPGQAVVSGAAAILEQL